MESIIETVIRHKDSFIYCTACQNKLETQDHYKTCPSCGKHYYFNPKPCVAIVLSNNKGNILLVKRAYEPFKGWWDIPGGFLEENETLEQALKRELKEETGLRATDVQYLGSLFADYHFQKEIVPVTAAIFSGQIKGSSKVVPSDDASDYMFIPKDQLDFDHIAFPEQQLFLKKLFKKVH